MSIYSTCKKCGSPKGIVNICNKCLAEDTERVVQPERVFGENIREAIQILKDWWRK